jgi:hypothetical protein
MGKNDQMGKRLEACVNIRWKDVDEAGEIQTSLHFIGLYVTREGSWAYTCVLWTGVWGEVKGLVIRELKGKVVLW